MAAKDIQKLIITLIVLLIGINILSFIGRNSIAGLPISNVNNLVPSLASLTNLLSIGIIIIIILLIPLYLSKRSEEKKYGTGQGKFSTRSR